MPSPGFLQELKRRHVWRVAVAYAIVGWLLIQVATQVFPVFHMPDWTEQLVVLLVLLGFPVAVILAWAFEVTPEGIRRTEPATSDDARAPEQTRRIGRGLDFVIIGVLVLAVAFMGWRLFLLHPAATTAAASGTVAPATTTATGASVTPAILAKAAPSDTLVVLPFTNLGNDPRQTYFSDGITEELTNALGQNTGLRVIAWDTASKYRDGKQSASDVGRQLNVANVLTGKILRQGNQVRVIVELVNAATGYQTWSHHYDDSLSNIFAVQDKISASIASALKVKFASTRATNPINPRAHDLVLQTRALIQTARDAAPYEQARALLEQAIALDPDYAEAHAQLARTWSNLIQYSTLPIKEALPKALEEAHTALKLDPANVSALIVVATVDAAEGRIASATAGYRRAIALDPSNATAHLDYALMLPRQQALAETLEATRLDPDNATVQNNLANTYMNSGEYAQALPASQALVRLAPHSASSAFGLAMNYALLHRNQDAIQAFDLVQPGTPLARQLVSAGKLAYQAALDPKLHAKALAAAEMLRKRSDLDPDSVYDLFQVYFLLGKKDIALDLLDRSCIPVPFSCSDLAINPTYIPLRGDPRFEALTRKYANAPIAAAGGAEP